MARAMEFGWRRMPATGVVVPPPPPPTSTTDPDAAAYFAALAPGDLNSGAQEAINTLVLALKSAGVWTKLDRLHIGANASENAALRDLRQPAKTFTPAGGLVWSALGYAGNGATAYLNFGEYYNGSGNAYAQNDAAMGLLCTASGGQTTAVSAMGTVVWNASYGNNFINIAVTGAEMSGINNGGTYLSDTSPGTRVGHRAITRTASDATQTYLNGSPRGSVRAFASMAVQPNNACMFKSATSYCADRLAAGYSGRWLNDTEMAALHAALTNYIASI